MKEEYEIKHIRWTWKKNEYGFLVGVSFCGKVFPKGKFYGPIPPFERLCKKCEASLANV